MSFAAQSWVDRLQHHLSTTTVGYGSLQDLLSSTTALCVPNFALTPNKCGAIHAWLPVCVPDSDSTLGAPLPTLLYTAAWAEREASRLMPLVSTV